MSEVTRFVGSIPEHYDRYLGPILFEPYARDLVQRLPATARRVLEVAAGTGRLTRNLVTRLAADAELVATDLNEPMIAVGQRHVSDPRVRWHVADAQALPGAAAQFDAVVCQFGIMFVPDKSLELREMRRVLRSGGALLLNTWDSLERNPGHRLIHELTSAAMPSNPPTFMLTPFALPDPAVLRALVTDAGFRDVNVETVAIEGLAETAHHFATGLVAGNPLWNQLVERGIDAPAFVAHAAERVGREFGAAPCRLPLSAHVLTAIA